MVLPDRLDGSPGGRISAKTYEYLMTDRPVLAALPPGENREYLEDKSGVYLVDPAGVSEMAEVVARLAADQFDGASVEIDRTELRSSLLSTTRACSFKEVILDSIRKAKNLQIR
jgi:glycosyltransferase involved in cell wall biosynthesis